MEINSIGTQQPTLPTNVQDQMPTEAVGSSLSEQASEISEEAENAFGSLFFSLLQNILSEAQSNSGS